MIQPLVCYCRHVISIPIFVIVLFGIAFTAHAQVTPGDPGNFITTWNTENPGTSATNQITIPHTTGTYDYQLYWENTASSTMNGTTTVSGINAASSPTLTFPEPGIYRVEIVGDFPQIFFNNSGDRQKILQVNRWGSIAWSSMANAFRGASNLRVPATDAPDLSGVTNLNQMFAEVTQFNDPIGHWDVSNVQTAIRIFANTNFNQNINNWNVANITSFRGLFTNTPFNQPLDNWNTINAIDMVNMFWRASKFNQNISMWNMSNVTEIGQMFSGATSFNQPLNNWDVSKVFNMKSVFSGATSFNQPLNNWNVSSVTEFGNCPVDTEVRGMFLGASAFNQDLSDWNITNVVCMNNFFENTALSQQNLDATLQSWATQAVDNDIRDIPFHLGLKTYSSTGASAKATLESLGWTITEQYRATYAPSTRGTLIGSGMQAPINNGSSTTAIEVRPDRSCAFKGWSDGSMDNPRTDTLTDNLSVEALIACSSGSSIQMQIKNLEAMGKTAEADALRTATTPMTLTDTITTVEGYINGTIPFDRSKAKELIDLLLALVATLTQLMVEMAVREEKN